MSVSVDSLTTDVHTEGGTDAAGPVPADKVDQRTEMETVLMRIERDRMRTRSEGFDD